MAVKTVFITSFNPFVSRNILETDVLKLLAQNNKFRIVIFVPDYKIDYFEKKFARNNVIIEGLRKPKISKQDILFGYLASSLADTSARLFHQKEKLSRDKNYIHFLVSRFLAKFLSKSSLVKRTVRELDFFTMNNQSLSGYFGEYSPSLVFATDVFNNYDIHFMAQAKKRRITTVGMVRSWDNITNKGLFRVKPDKLIVHNKVIENEVVEYEDMNPADIFVSGMPQFDCYVNESRMAREDFFEKIGFDSSCRLVFVAPLGQRFIDTDGEVLQILKEALNNNLIPADVRFLVRFPPNDDVVLGSFKPDRNFFIYKPGVSFKKGVFADQEVTNDEEVTLADSLYHSELCVIYASTLSIDAAAFAKPVVLVSFDGRSRRPELKSVKRFVKYYDHIRKMLETESCLLAEDERGLVDGVNTYLANPALDRDKIELLLAKQAGRLDGQSGARITSFIIQNLESRK